MFKKLQYKFILISSLATLFAMFIIYATLNVSLYLVSSNQIHEVLNYLNENNGVFPFEPADPTKPPSGDMTFNEETKYKTRYFSVVIDANNNILSIDTQHISAVDAEEAREYFLKAFRSNSDFGKTDIYYYSRVLTKEGNIRFTFIDCSYQLSNLNAVLIYSTIIFCSAWALSVIIISLFSKKAVKPYEDSFENEKRFITDASHELKTPLSIIQANSEVLSLENPSNEWIESTKKQTKRLTSLVNDLILLTKLDETTASLTFEKTNLSELALEIAVPYRTIANRKKLDYTIDIADDIHALIDSIRIEKVISILLDNAMKYCSKEGKIKITLEEERKTAILKVYNTCDKITPEILKKVFDRFYCADESHSKKSGGFGIGLSIGKTIIDAHKGIIKAETSDNKSVTFTIKLKTK